MTYDRLADRPTEHELILGTVVGIADSRDVPVPTLGTLLTLLRA